MLHVTPPTLNSETILWNISNFVSTEAVSSFYTAFVPNLIGVIIIGNPIKNQRSSNAIILLFRY